MNETDPLVQCFREVEQQISKLNTFWFDKGGEYTSPDTSHIHNLWKTDRKAFFEESGKLWEEHKQPDFTQQWMRARRYIYDVFLSIIHTFHLVDFSNPNHRMILTLIDMYQLDLLDDSQITNKNHLNEHLAEVEMNIRENRAQRLHF